MFNLVYFIGLYALGFWLCDVLRSPLRILYYELAEVLGHDKIINLKQKYGNWAAITGATDGIGKAYAKEFAKRGINVILISRTEAKLKTVAREIEAEFHVHTKYIVADFSQGATVYAHIERELNYMTVRILVNNVGQSTSQPGNLSSFDAKEIWSVINTNIVAITQLSRYFLKRMQAEGNKAIIVNISSSSEMQPLPYAATYAATKAYTRSLTLALQHETRSTNVDVQLVSPNFVVTKINASSSWLMRGNFFIPDAEKYARWAVNRIGQVDETSGFYWHGLFSAIWKVLPLRITTWVVAKLAYSIIDKDKQNLMNKMK